MNNKTIFICVTALAVLVAGVAVAVFFLYSGTSSDNRRPEVSTSDAKYGFYMAVPSDAASVIRFDKLENLLDTFAGESPYIDILPSGKFRSFLDSLKTGGEFRSSSAILSFHYIGGLEPLLVIDAGRARADIHEAVEKIRTMASRTGIFCSLYDCSASAEEGTYLSRRQILVLSANDALVSSSERHIANGISVLDQEGFAEAVEAAQGTGAIAVVSNTSAGRILEELCTVGYRRYSDFIRRISDWTAVSFDILSENRISVSGSFISGKGADKFINVFRTVPGAGSRVTEVLPSYTVSAFSVPVSNLQSYVSAVAAYYDTRIGQSRYMSVQESLKRKCGISPSDWVSKLNLREIAVASFFTGSDLESVLLLRPGCKDLSVIFDGTGTSPDKYDGSVLEFRYGGFVSSLFGTLFSLDDETSFCFRNGWIIAGGRQAVDEFASGRALDGTLAARLENAGLSGRPSDTNFSGYFSFTEDSRIFNLVFSRKYAGQLMRSFDGVSFAPALLNVAFSKGLTGFTFSIDKVREVKMSAPSFERDTSVAVPEGPFKVKNSGTGKMNSFYQQENMYLCLNDENGKGLWGVEFHTPICGRASTIDYFKNGKLQIIFASGSRLYLLDRLGRRVSGFPVDLGKEIRLGPDVYDFNGRRTYNVMILHKDNTVEMYNLHGRKPAQWKGITSKEKIKGLPEPVKVGGSTWWVVRTSMQTLIFPFYGGDPVTVYEGDKMIRPDSPVEPVDGGVKVTRYDGRTVTVHLSRQ